MTNSQSNNITLEYYRSIPKPVWLIGLHFGLAFLCVQFVLFGKAFSLILIVYAIYDVIKTRDNEYQAGKWAAYFTGLELLLRITRANILHEFVKYVVLILLVVGILVSFRKHSFGIQFVFYLLCLLPSLFVLEIPEEANWRKTVLFNMSGPLALFAASYYFSNISLTKSEIQKLLTYFLLPIVATSFVLFFKTNISELKFTGVSNYQASGGFGPNQVSTILGLGVLLFIIFFLFKFPFSGYRWLDICLLGYVLFRGVITFSRGGVISGIICAILAFTLLFLLGEIKLSRRLILSIVIVPTLLGITAFVADSITNGLITKRYLGQNRKGEVKEDVTAGRLDILLHELDAFGEFPILGTGPGGGKFFRLQKGEESAASHNEVGRLVAEHGVLGIVALMILFFTPLFKFFRVNTPTKVMIISFITLALLTFNHAAMRTAMSGFVYGLGLVSINWKNEEDD